jgi:hypothetical protein
MILTGINVPTEAADLLDRSLIVELDRIEDDNRREESELWRAFDAVAPSLFGGLLDTLAETIRIYPSIKPPRLPRMADWARWGAAASEALGYGADAFFDALDANVELQAEAALEDPIAQAIRRLMRNQSDWIGTPTGLYETLLRINGGRRQGDRWPGNASAFSKRLRLLETPLHNVGISVSHGKVEGERHIAIRRAADSNKEETT